MFIMGCNVIFTGTVRKWELKDNVQKSHIAQYDGYPSALIFLDIFMDICALYVS